MFRFRKLAKEGKKKTENGTKIMNKGLKKEGPVKKKGDDAFDLEQQFILRLPPGPAMALRHDVDSGVMNLKEKLFIDLQNDFRTGTVRYGGQIFNSKLYDLPTVIETQKTTDNKSFYKTADICQIMLVNDNDEDSQDEDMPRRKEKDKYHWNHGITPPMKNVRKRRFRRQLRKKYLDQPDIEKEVKRLFRTDNEAVSVRWEIVTEDDKAERSGTVGVGEPSLLMSPGDTKDQMDLENIFGEVSSSEDEDDAGSDTDRKTALDDEDSRLEGMTADMENAEVQAKLKELSDQLAELREKRVAQEAEIASIDNVALQKRFEDVLNEIVRQEEEKSTEYEILAAMV